MDSPKVGAIGVAIKARIIEDGVPVDISAATTMQIILSKPPNGATVTKTAVHITDGLDGWLQYVTQAGDLSVAGDWEYEPYVVLPSGYTGRGSAIKFEVLKNL